MSYTWRLEIAILAGGSVAFSGDTPRQRDLGGAEYCTVMLAEALTKLGHRVTVFTADSPDVYGSRDHLMAYGVAYYPRERAFREVCRGTQWDVFICSRDYAALSSTFIQAKMLVLWNHDILSDPDTFREHIGRADKIYCLSTYHKDQFLRALSGRSTHESTLKPEHISVTRNGVDKQLMEQVLVLLGSWDGKKAAVPTFIYTSRPERGLKYLLRDIWPGILKVLPDAELGVACYDMDAELLPERIAHIHRECFTMIKQQPSVTFLGALSRRDLFIQVARAHALLYPSVFPEVSCLSVLEAQALGTPALTSRRGALSESNWSQAHMLFNDTLVEEGYYGRADYDGWVFNWIGAFVDTYQDSYITEERLRRQHNVQHYYDWELIAQEWEADFYAHFYARSHTYKKRVIENLLYHSDILAAEWALINYLRPTSIPSLEDVHMPQAEWQLLHDQVTNHLKVHHVEPEQYAGHESSESLPLLPDRMKIALDLIEKAYGHDEPFTLLDVGMGSGRFLYHVLTRFHNCRVMGMDFSEKLCEQAGDALYAAFPSLKDSPPFIFHCDPLELNIEEFFDEANKPDVVVAAEWLEHQADLDKALYTVHRLCKVAGLVIYTTPYGPWEAISFGDAKTPEGDDIRFHVSHFEHKDFEEMFAEVDYVLEASYTQLSPIDMATLGNFVLSYRKPAHPVRFYTPDYERKFITTRPYTRIAGFLITKDEEDNISRALKPLQKRFDKLLVYDTGSTDKTVERALPLAGVLHGFWDNDFALARNEALHHLRTHYDADWIYWQDADEVLLNAYKLRFYTQGDLRIFQGLIITQNHLMIDNPMTVDIPIRLFRNSPDYKFIGRIHEHVLDSRDPDGNTNLAPLLILPDVKIIHYGYVTEEERRWKARHRNWDILKQDLTDNPRRELTKIFLMRDYVQHVRWHLERSHTLAPEHVGLLHQVITLHEPFKDPTQQNHVIARVFYQDALRLLGEHHLPTAQGLVPIQAAIVLAAKRGPFPPGEEFVPEMRWFRDAAELESYVSRHLQEAAKFVARRPRLFED